MTISSTVDFRGIYVSGTPTAVVTAQGNTIQNINLSNLGSTTFRGFDISSGGLNTGTGNTIGHASTANSIVVAGSSTTYGINISSGALTNTL